MASREAIDAQTRRAWRALWTALSADGSHGLAPLAWPAREVDVELVTSDLWGTHAVELTHRPTLVRSLAARAIVPGASEGASHEAAREFEALIEQLLDAAPEEYAIRRLGQALSHTTRLVNTLEQRVAARLAADVAEIRRTLSEREREEQLRIKHVIARRRRADRPR